MIPFLLFLGMALFAVGANAKAQATATELTAKHPLPMDGKMPVATHVRKGRKWVPSNATEDALFATQKDSNRRTASLQSTARVPQILGLPRSCISQNQCCPNSALAKVSNSAVGSLPFSSVVLISLVLEQNDGEVITAYCSGTLALRSNIILTAGHCVTEITGNNLYTTLRSAVVYFGLRAGTYDKVVKVTSYATFNDWYNRNIEVADQALLKLQTGQSRHVYGTQDITRRFSHASGYHEPYTSVGFPGGGRYGNPYTMYYTPNPHRNQCMGFYAPGTDISGTYGLPLAIRSGMSGGPVLNKLGLIIATNSFNLPSSCSSGLCYNGYTPIDNTHYPLGNLLKVL